MPQPIDFSGKPFHFIGIGGIGMSAIARILLEQGFPVSGSDLNANRITAQLEELGATIYRGHNASNISASMLPQVVCSSAIGQANPELAAAQALQLPLWHRSDVLAALMERYRSIAIAGTHGKTTTSSLVSYILLRANLDPTIIVGGEVSAWEGNARLGKGEYLVAEADESDGSLVKFSPAIGAITNIELDHPDYYSTLEHTIATFSEFAGRCQTVVACTDCPNVRASIKADITCALHETAADYVGRLPRYSPQGTTFDVYERGQPLGSFTTPLLGEHNVKNALAAIAVARHLGVDVPILRQALSEFTGASRRFERKGTYNGIAFVDDYAHHPSEIRATLAAARLQTSRKVVAIFQPHRYSRTIKLLAEFGAAFTDADTVVVTDIYGAGETSDGRITGAEVVAAIANGHPDVHYQPTLTDVRDFLVKHLRSGDLAMFLGAGNLNQIIAPTMGAIAEDRAQCGSLTTHSP